MSLTEHLVEIKCPKIPFSAHTHKGSGPGYYTSATLLHGNLGLCCVALWLLGVGESTKYLASSCYTSLLWLQYFYFILKFCPLSQSSERLEAPQHPGTRWQRWDKLWVNFWPPDTFLVQTDIMQGLEFLICFSNEVPVDSTGVPNKQFSAQMPNGSFSTLKI